MKKKTSSLSIVIPVYNEIENLPSLLQRIKISQTKWPKNSELIFVNDGSSDSSLDYLKRHKGLLHNAKVLDLTKNFGHQAALLAGLTASNGEVIGCLDADLQDPPELIEKMLKQMHQDKADVIYGVRKNRKEGAIKTLIYWLAYRVLNKVLRIQIPLDSGDFCLMKKNVKRIIITHHDQNLFLRGLRAWVGFKQVPFIYSRDSRFKGKSNYSFSKLLELGFNGIVGFTNLPILFLGVIGVIGLTASLCYMLFLVTALLLNYPSPPGFVSLMVALLLFSSIQLLAIWVIGFYVCKNYEETRKRPTYLVKTIY